MGNNACWFGTQPPASTASIINPDLPLPHMYVLLLLSVNPWKSGKFRPVFYMLGGVKIYLVNKRPLIAY
jgi:hypothetical protein